MKKLLKGLVPCILLLQSVIIHAQQALPFWNEIQAFKRQDSIRLPPAEAILFTGSSSFRLWDSIKKSFPSHTIINRGFGGSSLPDMIRYADDLILPYSPKQIVIYCGENDIAGSDSATGEMVFERFKELFMLIRQKLPATPVAYVSMKPSPSRWHLKEKMMVGNRLIKSFLQQNKNTAFIDVWPSMLTAEGLPMNDIFKEDKLHMTPKGYAIWQKIIEPYLLN